MSLYVVGIRGRSLGDMQSYLERESYQCFLCCRNIASASDLPRHVFTPRNAQACPGFARLALVQRSNTSEGPN